MFSTAVELAQSMELVEQQARLMNDRQEVEIDKIRVEKTSGSVEDSDYDHPALTEEQEELQPTDESQVMDSVVETAPADNVVVSRRYPQRSRHPPLRFSEEQLFM
jgi:hypothetical protein